MSLFGYTLPRTPGGPLLDRAAAAVALHRRLPRRRVLGRSGCGAGSPPRPLEPHPDPGRCAAIFGDWQTSSDDGEQLLRPARSQYKEFFIVVNALLDGEEVTTCPFTWVDRDFALARGWIQGFPKKLGTIGSPGISASTAPPTRV